MARSRSHEVAEELDEVFLDFLNSCNVQGTIRQTASNERRSVTFYWIEPAEGPHVDVSDFPQYLSFADAKLFARTQRSDL
jgi:hypothetical protein